MAKPANAFKDVNAPELLLWAAAYLLEHAQVLERSHGDARGHIRHPKRRLEVSILRHWCARIDELYPGAKDLELTFEPIAGVIPFPKRP